ncbi:MAG: carbamoyltransferase HypF [Bacillota bacterium]|nr:carbamoyltransferase HypF [Bacillota bacterium]
MKKHTEKIKLWGIVQGVGFRPFVAKMAKKLQMNGEVLNIGGLVEITVTDTPERIDEFLDALIANKPGPSEIVHIKRISLEYRDYTDFTILKSGEGDDEAAMIPADLAICPHCLEELYDPSNPRYQHPFISCMICGPRYTIIDKIPYDRDNTSMIDFPMCDFCEEEYTDIDDRRHHAQTISCHDCGPKLIWKNISDGSSIEGNFDTDVPNTDSNVPNTDSEILDYAASILKAGGVIAFKSVGGYNLVADPSNDDAVGKLRKIKNRPNKPFAVLFRDLNEIQQYCHVNEIEARLLASSSRPIILLEHKTVDSAELNRSRFIGSFLPSFAAQYMLLDRISPLIFTSANLSDMPMVIDDDEIMNLSTELDGVIYNRRRINIRVDDSVTRVIDNQPQMIRRSKGYAPVPLYIDAGSRLNPSKFSILATGSQLKNSFALSKGPFAYLSQYFGDMDTIENQNIYRGNISRMSDLFRIKPEFVVCDMHPLYFTTEFAQAFAQEHGLPILEVQHHHAHIASVMAENNLTGQVIGVSFDGTGYGTDGSIWGGEFLLCHEYKMERKSHLRYVPMIGGDSSMKDGIRSALSYISAYGNGYLTEDANADSVVDISDIIEFGKARILKRSESSVVLKAIENRINTIQSSSMGRLFDAVSSLLGICDYNTYEGQCAIMLEDAAFFAQKNPGVNRAYDLALDFHERVIDFIMTECEAIRNETGATQVALSGGTFQNKILMEGVLKKLRDAGFEPYYNISVSPNDGGIALGQLFIAMKRLGR